MAYNDKKKKRVLPNDFLSLHPFRNQWITHGADKELVEFTDSVGKYMAPHDKEDKDALSTSQVRNIFGEIKRIQLKGIQSAECKSSFYLLKPKVAYAEGRNKGYSIKLFKLIFDKGWDCVDLESENSASMYNNFCNLLEAILAYHKSYGGRD